MSEDNEVSIEVQRKNGLYYKAFIKDIYAEKLEVNFENSFVSTMVPFCEARLPQMHSDEQVFKEGDDIEVLVSDDGETWGWCVATLKLLKGEFAVVEFGSGSSDIISLDRIRLHNQNEPLNASSFCSTSFCLPDDLLHMCKDKNCHEELRKACGAEVLRVNNHTVTLISSSQEAIRRASLLSDMHLRNLRQKQLLLARLDDTSQRLESTKQVMKDAFQEEFQVDQELMGLAIGTRGTNLIQARSLPGVLSVDIESSSHSFHISGESEAAVKGARKLLEYIVKVVPVHKNLVSKVIGRSGHGIQEIASKSGVVRVRVDGHHHGDASPAVVLSDHNNEKDTVDFVFTGTPESTCNAAMLLDYQIGHLKEVDKLRQEKESLDEELKTFRRSTYRQGPQEWQVNEGTRTGRWSSERQVPPERPRGGRRTSLDASQPSRPKPAQQGRGEGRRRVDDSETSLLDHPARLNGDSQATETAGAAPRASIKRQRNRGRRRQMNGDKKQVNGVKEHETTKTNGLTMNNTNADKDAGKEADKKTKQERNGHIQGKSQADIPTGIKDNRKDKEKINGIEEAHQKA